MSDKCPSWMDSNTIGDTPPEMAALFEKARKAWIKMDAQREEIIEAFIAKYHCDPADCVQVIQCMPDGERKFFIRQRTQEEREMVSRTSSQL